MSIFWAHVIAFDVIAWAVIITAMVICVARQRRKAADELRMKRHVEDR